MIHLSDDSDSNGKRLTRGSFLDGDDEFDEEYNEGESGHENGGEQTLESFSKEVLSRLHDDGVPPIPNNFHLYFDRLLDEKPIDFKKQIQQILEIEEDDSSDEKRVNLEKRVKDSFAQTKQILDIVALLYKNLNLMLDIAKKRKEDATKAANVSAFQNTLTAFKQEIEKLLGIFTNQRGALKTLYQKSAKIAGEVESETIYDSTYGIYNKRYLVRELQKELKMIEKFNHNTTLVMTKLSSPIEKKIKSDKGRLLVTRTLSRLLLKTSRRSDIIAHYNNGVFALLLKHSNILSAKKASERLSDLVSSTNFFFGDSELQLKLSIGIAKVDLGRELKDNIKCAIEALNMCDENGEVFVVYPDDEIEASHDDDFDASEDEEFEDFA